MTMAPEGAAHPGRSLPQERPGTHFTGGWVWMGRKSRPHRDSIPDHPICSQLLYQLSYLAHIIVRWQLKGWISSEFFERLLAAVWNRKPRELLRKCEMFVLVAFKGWLTLEIKTIISFTNCNRAGTYMEIISQLQVLNIVVNRLLRCHQRPPKAVVWWVAYERWPCF